MSRLKNKGLTLIEVMLAVTILSVGLVLVVRSYTTSLRALKTSRSFLSAKLLVEEKIWLKEEEGLRTGAVVPEDESGKFEAPFQGFSYEISFEEQELDSPATNPYNLQQTTFEVSWQERQKKHSASCITFLRSRK